MGTFAFPRMFNRDTKHCVTNTSASKQISQSLHLLIMSCYGELLGEPAYGANIEANYFDKITGGMGEILRDKILTAVNKYLPWIQLSDNDIQFLQSDDMNAIRIIITYKIKNTTYRNVFQEDITNGNNGQ